MKMNTMIVGLIVAASTSIAMGGWAGRAPLAEAQAIIKVLDQSGSPAQGALITGWWFDYRTRSEKQGTPFSVQTDTNGCAVLKGITSGEFNYQVRKEGYYDTSGKYKEWMKLWIPSNPNIKNNRWQPWNPTVDVVLKQIKSPVPMYAKDVAAEIPVLDTPLGYDLLKADWVSPYGGGRKAIF